MPLTNCIECKKEVSVSAEHCPHCGFKEPGVSGRERQLSYQINKNNEFIEEYEDNIRRFSDGWFNRMINKFQITDLTEQINKTIAINKGYNNEILELHRREWH